MNSDLRKSLSHELEKLNSTLGGNPKKVKELVGTFIFNTPRHLDDIGDFLLANKFEDAAKVIHKVKVRYGYFGLKDLVADLELWEDQLKKGEVVLDHLEVMKDIKGRTFNVIEELKQFHFEGEEITHQTPLSLAGKVVLVAEDDMINAMVFDLFIKETGATTILATDGMQALALAKENNPDLIFMDVHMPFFSGLDAIKELRNLGCKCHIVSLSASTRLNERQNSIDAGANEFLVKPVNRATINRILFLSLS